MRKRLISSSYAPCHAHLWHVAPLFKCICELLPSNRINLEGRAKEALTRKSRARAQARNRKSGKENDEELDEEAEYSGAEHECLRKPDDEDTDRESVETAATELISDIGGSRRNLHISSRCERLQMRQRFSSSGQWHRLNRMMLANVYKALRIRWSRKFENNHLLAENYIL